MNKKLVIAILVIAAIVALVFFVSNRNGEEKISDLINIDFALTGTPDILDVPYFIAQEKGFFEEEGLSVNFSKLQGDAITVQAVVSGSVDVGAAGNFAIINAVSEGAPIKAFMSIQNSHDYLISGKETIKTTDELLGKRIAIFAPGDITEIVLLGFLKKFDIEANEVSLVSVGGGDDRFRAVIAGEVDAAVLHADFGSKLAQTSGFRTIASIAKEQPALMSVVFSTNDYLESNSDVVQSITNALIKATRYSVENKEEFIDVAVANIEGLTAEELGPVYDLLIEQNVFGVNGGLTEDSLSNAFTLLELTQPLDQNISPSDIVDFDFIKSAPVR